MEKHFLKLTKVISTSLVLLSASLSVQAATAGTVLVTNVLSNSLTFFDEDTLKPIKEISVGYMPHEVAVSPNGQYALVSNFGDLLTVIPGHSISAIDIANARVIQTIQLPKGSRPHGVEFISDAKALVTVQGIQSLLLIDFTNGKIEKTLKLPGLGAHMVKADLAKQFAYVANVDTGTVCKIDLRDFSVVGNVKIGNEAEGLALTSNEDLLLVTNRKDNFVAVLRTKDLSIYKTIPTGSGPVRVEMFANGDKAIVTNTLSGNAEIIDIASLASKHSFKTTDNINLLPVPINVSVRADQTSAYVTNSFAGNITLIDLINGKVLKTFKAGFMPDGVATSKVKAVNTADASSSEFTSGPIEINASIDTVWQIAKNVEDYYRLSNGSITAHVDGEIAPGKKIELILYKDKLIGKFIPPSNETVTVVDEDKKILVWVRKLPDGKYTERYQRLEKTADNKTLSFIGLRIPGIIGKVTKTTLGSYIDGAFQDLNNGIKAEAEKVG